jgi:DNA-binding transcriptional LysR family regulator
VGLHARRDYLARRGTPATLAELHQHALIGYDHESAFIRSMKHHLGDLTRANFALRSDSDMAQLSALRAGFGIGICQAALARRDPNLVRVLPEAFAPRLETWIAMHEDLRNSKRCTLVFAALADGLAAYIDG